jgi:hypothetical protein
MSKNTFAREWGNQTDIGRHFDMSSIALGKFLLVRGLRDPVTKQATEHALAAGYAKATPLQDGTPFFMWNRRKIADLLREAGKAEVPPLEYHTENVFKQASGYLGHTDDDKYDSLVWDCWPESFQEFLTEVPANIRDQVRRTVLDKLVKANLLWPESLEADTQAVSDGPKP